MTSKDNNSKNDSNKQSQDSTEASRPEEDYGEILREKLKGKQPIPDVRIETFPEISIRGVKSTEKGQKGKT